MTAGAGSIESISHEARVFPVPAAFAETSHLGSLRDYERQYRESVDHPETFWGRMAESFQWIRPWSSVLSYDWKESCTTRWFEGAATNITLNALDRHLEKNGDRLAFLWVGNEPGTDQRITYRELHQKVCRMANVLRQQGVRKGDRVTIYLPMIPELPIAMLACARLGAIHSVVFGGFSAEALKDRILDCGSKILVTADGGFRGPKKIGLKDIADRAMELAAAAGQALKRCLVVKRTGDEIPMHEGRDLWLAPLIHQAPETCAAEPMDAEDPLFILYTSGSTGKPKGVLHTTAGYMVYAATTFRYVFDYRPEDLYWCTADIGWITGHTYMVYGPLCEGARSILYEGVPNYPQPDRLWEVIDRYRISILYTAPTAIRALMREGESWPAKHDLSSLRLLGTVGEPINPEAWIWYHEKIGHGACPIVDTWWQTETGGILITPLPGAMALKPGSASRPFFGIVPDVLREDGSSCAPNEGGLLVIRKPWPGIMRTVYGHHERFKETYFSRFPGLYFTGDGARADSDGDYWIIGRVDDVLKVSGHRIGTAEVESSLVSHAIVAEAAVVGIPHDIKGEAIYAYVTLKDEALPRLKDPHLEKELKDHVRKEVGPIAVPDTIQFTQSLPKTRSGKIMRRILRKIASGHLEEVGDTTTLADPSVVDQLIEGKKAHP